MTHSDESICTRCGTGGRYGRAGGCIVYNLVHNSRRVITVSNCDDFEEVDG